MGTVAWKSRPDDLCEIDTATSKIKVQGRGELGTSDMFNKEA